MKQQDLIALTKGVVDRAVAYRESAGAQLTTEQIKQVSGGCDAASKDACKMTVLEQGPAYYVLSNSMISGD